MHLPRPPYKGIGRRPKRWGRRKKDTPFWEKRDYLFAHTAASGTAPPPKFAPVVVDEWKTPEGVAIRVIPPPPF